MASVFPKRLPSLVQADPGRSAERKVYEALSNTLDDSFSVFYGVAWLSNPRNKSARDGEIDFVIAHPDRGILLIEVKGGRIGRDGETGTWASMDRSGNVHKIKDPIEQLRQSKFALLEKMKEHPYWRNRFIGMGHAIVFPDCETPNSPLSTDAPFGITLFAADVDRVGEKIVETFEYWHRHGDGEFGLGKDGIKLLTQLLAPSFELRMPLGAAIAEDDRQILTLTEQQFKVLDHLSRQRRVAISGGAGTGKTVLAMEKAKRLAGEGLKVLLTCFNRPLAEYLKASAGDVENLEIASFHQFCYRMAKEGGIALPRSGTADRNYFDRTMPDALLKSLDETATRFDGIVVDEGQDFLESWWDPLQFCLSEPDTGILYVFYDDNQKIYRRVSTFPKGLSPITLFENLRNTKRIHTLANRFYNGADVIATGPEGRDVQVVHLSNPQRMPQEVSRVLHRLIRVEEVPPRDIAVLCGKAIDRGAFGQSYKIGAFEVTVNQEVEPDKVLLQTIHSFKGLERPVIVLTDIDGLAPAEADRLLYVGVSRARVHLVIVAAEESFKRFKVEG